MGLFKLIRASGNERYRELANPASPFERVALLRLLDELRPEQLLYDVRVENIPHHRYNRVSWDFFTGYPTKAGYWAYQGIVNYYVDDVNIWRMKLMVSYPWQVDQYDDHSSGSIWYPMMLSFYDITSDTEHPFYYWNCHCYWEPEPLYPERSQLIADLTAGWADIAMGLLGYPTIIAKLDQSANNAKYPVWVSSDHVKYPVQISDDHAVDPESCSYHAEGYATASSGYSHAEGYATAVYDMPTHAEGIESQTSGDLAFDMYSGVQPHDAVFSKPEPVPEGCPPVRWNYPWSPRLWKRMEWPTHALNK